MHPQILACLTRIEREHGVHILYAAESGSRAWGFASPDSDYDVRFVYIHAVDHYLGIAERRDVVELPVNALLDVNGWDVRKALALFRKSNAPLYEWLRSPIVYRRDERFFRELSALMPDYFSLRAGCHHYLSMTRNAYENDLRGETVRLKKYFYALRPLLAAGWILEHRTVPPMEFAPLRTLIREDGVQQAIDDLLERKQASDEKTLIPPVAILQDFITERLAVCQRESAVIEPHVGEEEPLNRLFRSLLPA
jgi:predicted nucleotidyltransferase